jgi:CheY-like chemotaxis protein
MPKILLVEDDKPTADLVIEYAHMYLPEISFSQERTGDGALKKILSESPDLVILDLALADDVDGIEVVRRIAATDKRTQFILVTALGNKAFRGPRPGRPWVEQLQDHEKAMVVHFFDKGLFDWKTFFKVIATTLGIPISEQLENMESF